MMVISCLRKLQKSVSLFVPRKPAPHHLDEEQQEAANELVAEDVKEGHFAVVAMKGEETRRFIVKLDYLTDPVFIGLLEQAREEYGFRQKGTLAVPCRPQELQKILEGSRKNCAKGEGSFVDGRDVFQIPSTQAESNVSKPLSRGIILRGIVSFINIRLHIKNILCLSKD